ncbi:hypothetical protein K501DRAFT_327019 [Backusella circina FSU 941]|nr:hypothetical protein K501DRAFT_327019 [Backusella circina FSU 941]
MDYFAYGSKNFGSDSYYDSSSTNSSPDESKSLPITPTIYIHDYAKACARPTYISYSSSLFTPDTKEEDLFSVPTLSSSLPSPLITPLGSFITPSLSLPSSSVMRRRFSNPPTTPSPRLHILLVDDNSINLRILSRLLNIHMSDKIEHLELVKSGEKALEVLKHKPFDLILMDIDMPGLNGLETTQHIRSSSEFDILQRNRNIPIVAVTTNDSREWRQTYLKTGMVGCISKPISPKDMKQTLSVILDIHLPAQPFTPE